MAEFRKKSLFIPGGLKPSDFYLYMQMQKYFNFNIKQVFVLGLRTMYACAHGGITREQLLNLAVSVNQDDLERDTEAVQYKELEKIITL